MRPPNLLPDFKVKHLTFERDAKTVRAFYEKAADYVRLETGNNPDTVTMKNFFISCPPGGIPAKSYKLGLCTLQGDLVAIADLGFGFPDPKDAYLGLMLFDPAFRGQGLGPGFLAHVKTLAKSRNAANLYLAVLDQNKRARAFWHRMGFRHAFTAPAMKIGTKSHVRHRLVLPL